MAATIETLRSELNRLRDLGGNTYGERARLGLEIRRLEKETPPVPRVVPYAACCRSGVVVGGCVCSYVTKCVVHGERHHGTHE